MQFQTCKFRSKCNQKSFGFSALKGFLISDQSAEMKPMSSAALMAVHSTLSIRQKMFVVAVTVTSTLTNIKCRTNRTFCFIFMRSSWMSEREWIVPLNHVSFELYTEVILNLELIKNNNSLILLFLTFIIDCYRVLVKENHSGDVDFPIKCG